MAFYNESVLTLSLVTLFLCRPRDEGQRLTPISPSVCLIPIESCEGLLASYLLDGKFRFALDPELIYAVAFGIRKFGRHSNFTEKVLFQQK